MRCVYGVTRRTPSSVRIVIQFPNLPIDRWYDFQGDDVLSRWVRLGHRQEKISTDHRLLFLCAALVSDRGQHVSTLMDNINRSCDQIFEPRWLETPETQLDVTEVVREGNVT